MTAHADDEFQADLPSGSVPACSPDFTTPCIRRTHLICQGRREEPDWHGSVDDFIWDVIQDDWPIAVSPLESLRRSGTWEDPGDGWSQGWLAEYEVSDPVVFRGQHELHRAEWVDWARDNGLPEIDNW